MTTKPPQPAVSEADTPDTSRDWAGMDGATAFQLITRHADDWGHARRMMDGWRLANPPEALPTASTLGAGDGGELEALRRIADMPIKPESSVHGPRLRCSGCGHAWLTVGEAPHHSASCPREIAIAALSASAQPRGGDSFQSRVAPWMQECFGAAIASDVVERGDRLLEETLELLQSQGYDRARVPTLTEYVFNRPVGEPAQEVGGVMVTLAAYCLATGLDMHAAGETELARIWTKVPQIRAKQASKNGLHGPLPTANPSSADLAGEWHVCPVWVEECRRALEDVSTEMRATGRGDSRFQRILSRMPRLSPRTSGVTDAEVEPMFYIQDSRSYVGNCPLWWRPDGKGYTTRIDEAGKYTKAQAETKRDTDKPWPCAFIDSIQRPTIDMQDLRAVAAAGSRDGG